ncbi:hypothetical protein C4571_02175 [Candidatus Parcubacteria bacterium]|nr:MAG: hypothetical protein C4571_02175 [Candidatus Parcubacteria bacterium]
MEGEPCGECKDCPHYKEAFSRFTPEYAAYVSRLQRGILRLKLAPTLAGQYSLREIDLMALMIAHAEQKAAEKAKENAKTS